MGGYRFLVDADKPHLGGNIAEGDPLTHAPKAWGYLVDRFAVRSVLDVGSGLGYAARWFHRQGIETVAVDGLEYNVMRSVYPAVQHDFTEGPFLCSAVDLVHCQEVVEHVEEQFVPNLMEAFGCGKIVVISHAVPGQQGYHHVNLQGWEYWVERFRDRGFRLLEEDTQRVRDLARGEGALHLSNTGLVFSQA